MDIARLTTELDLMVEQLHAMRTQVETAAALAAATRPAPSRPDATRLKPPASNPSR